MHEGHREGSRAGAEAPAAESGGPISARNYPETGRQIIDSVVILYFSVSS